MQIVSLLLTLMLALSEAMPSVEVNGVDEWEHFKATHGKFYEAPAIEELRKNIYLENKKFIEEHNERYNQGLTTFSMKMNHFGDMLHHEFLNKFNNFERVLPLNLTGEFFEATRQSLPASVDWRKAGAVTPVKNQGTCGSCWTFSITGGIEGQIKIKKGQLISLSEQQLLDCTSYNEYANNGCVGGYKERALNYVINIGGIETEQSYPYTGQVEKCKFNNMKVAAKVTSYGLVPRGDESALQEAVAMIGPVSVEIDTKQQSFQFYHAGVYEDENCSKTKYNHAVLIVGYGEEGGVPYWLIKNSWGQYWGEHGYLKLRRNQNMCSVAVNPSYPQVA